MNIIPLYTFVRREFERFLRVPIQTLASPWISASLYILVFGVVIGSRIQFSSDFSYIDFVLPGILMMNIITAAFGQSSASLYFQRFSRAIEEILTAPLSYTQMIIGYMTGALVRAMIVAFGIFILALFFTKANMDHVGAFFFYVIIVSLIFSLLGLLVGLWAEKFEHLSVLQTFIITPLMYVGGIFNSISMLPESIQPIAKLNPFFYMVDGLRYSMISFSESNLMFGVIFLLGLFILLFVLVFSLFKKGYKLRY
ncbi:MAG: ABC transporter permease [Patescibacteria group bacterium]